jgi:single-stranded-DNA-specific exonuclease
MKWNILSDSSDNIVETLLFNRGLKTKKEVEVFLTPPDPKELTPKAVGISEAEVKKALDRIQLAIKNQEQIVVYGDYDADGMCSTAIIWEALQKQGAKVLPFIPLREKEGYGLSVEGIDSILEDEKYVDPKLVISVDSGIVAHEAVFYAKSKGIDTIILDHHEIPDKLPKALAIVHTTELCAAGISYVFAKELGDDGLELAAIATITDLMPLLGPNRSIVKFGLEKLNKTQRPGLKSLLKIAGIDHVGTYEIGYMIGPRLNASGRIDSALLGLRLLCTKNSEKADEYAAELNRINKDRQLMLEEQVNHALLLTISNTEKIIVIEDPSYHQGVIGLIAGKLTERYYLPSIVIAKGELVSKASARSISGFNIIEAIREAEGLLINAGGHPMAAGFSIETINIEKFKGEIIKVANELITAEMLEKVLRVDMEIPLESATEKLYQEIISMAPFGLGNPEPVFASAVTVQDMRTVGSDGKHLKLKLSGFDAIAFGKGERAKDLKIGDKVKVAYTLDMNTWNNRQNLQLKIKDIVLE